MALAQNKHIIQLPITPPDPDSITPHEIAQTWLTALEARLTTTPSPDLSDLFHLDSWWRDMVALSWDLRTIQTLPKIQSFIRRRQPHAQLSGFRLQDEGKFQPKLEKVLDSLSWVSSMFFFNTRVGHGTGVLRLTRNEEGAWKAYSVYTSLQGLKGFVEPVGRRRAEGTIESMPGGLGGGNWKERRERQAGFVDEEPTVLVVGAGQAGLNIAARLQSLGVSCLIVDKNQRVGDNWRNRYRTLVTHDPAEYTHMAYLPFPPNWPQFTPKDKLGDWFESYASIMELNIWSSTAISSATYHDSSSTWVVTLTCPSLSPSTRTIHPRHIVWCTGHSGEPRVPSIPGRERFKGTVYHGSEHDDASRHDVRGKKVLVVGTGNSGHDIAQNFYENGADTTMLQRGGTYVISTTGVGMMHEGLHEDDGPPTTEADIISESLPFAIQFALSRHFTARVASSVDKHTLTGLRNAGFEIDTGLDGAGLARAYFTQGGGYYIDVGCSQLIIDGKIKVRRSEAGISHFTERGVVLNSHLGSGGEGPGEVLDADVVVLATGYENMRSTVRRVLGDGVADRCLDVWDLDGEGELNAMYRPSGHPGFWFMGGNLALCRIYSKFLGLQIKGIEAGLVDDEEEEEEEKIRARL